MKKIISLIICLFLFQNCVPVLIGAVAYGSTKNKKERRLWTENFNKTNQEREEKGLEPLDWCTEASKFDYKWAKKNKDCKAQLESQEK